MTESTSGRLSRLVRTVLFLSVSICGAGSCGGEGASRGNGEPLDVRMCSDNWRTIYSPEQEPFTLLPTSLGWHGDRLYTVVWERLGSRLVSFPDIGGEKQTLEEERVVDATLVVEGDKVLFVGLGDPVSLTGGVQGAPLLLESIPASGGTSQVIATIRDAAADPTVLQAWAVDSEQVYSVESQQGSSAALWASPRGGGQPRMLASLGGDGDFTLFNGIQPAGDRVLVYPEGIGFDRPVYSIPKAGGEAQRLPTAWQAATLIGVTTDGTVLVQRQSKTGSDGPRSDRFEVGRLLPGADAVEPFWLDQPPATFALKAWDDGAGGLYVQAWELGPHEELHATMWSIDADGRGRRLACDPLVGSRILAAAFGPTGIYGVTQLDNTVNYWSVVKISR